MPKGEEHLEPQALRTPNRLPGGERNTPPFRHIPHPQHLTLLTHMITTQDLETAAAEGRVIAHAHLSGRDLSDLNLEGLLMWHCQLHNADLSGSNLRNARFEGCALNGANLTSTILDGAEFSIIDAMRADFSGASMVGMTWQGGSVRLATLADVNAEGSTWSGTRTTGAIWPGTSLKWADCRSLDNSQTITTLQADGTGDAVDRQGLVYYNNLLRNHGKAEARAEAERWIAKAKEQV